MTLHILGPIGGDVALMGTRKPDPKPSDSQPAKSPAAADALAQTKPLAPVERRGQVAILVDGIGLSDADSRRASDGLPSAISFAVSPYAATPENLLAEISRDGHEYLLSLPMEPTGFPLNDAGPHALLTGAPQDRNDANLAWALSRIVGEVGVTGALDGQRGERFASVAALLNPVLAEVDRRGMFYVDPRPGTAASPLVASRTVDLVLDDPPDRATIDRQLQQLELIARDKGAALGLAGPPRPVLIERLAAWSATLENRGLILVPVSRLVHARPAAQTDRETSGLGVSDRDIAADLPPAGAEPR